jgi:hypothetical protein
MRRDIPLAMLFIVSLTVMASAQSGIGGGGGSSSSIGGGATIGPFSTYSACPLSAGTTQQIIGNNFTAFNTWDLNACNTTYAFNTLNPSTHIQSTLLGMQEQSGIPDIAVNAIHGQATATNPSGTGGLVEGVFGEADLWSGAAAGYTQVAGIVGTCEDHTGVITTDCAGGLFFTKNDATANGVGQQNGVHIQSNINAGTTTSNCGLCIDNQAGIATTNNWAIRTGTATHLWGDVFQSAGTKPTLTGTGACATSDTQVGGAWAGTFRCTGATAASTVTLTFDRTLTNGYVCNLQDETTRANIWGQTSQSPTTCVLTATSITQNDIMAFSAPGGY